MYCRICLIFSLVIYNKGINENMYLLERGKISDRLFKLLFFAPIVNVTVLFCGVNIVLLSDKSPLSPHKKERTKVRKFFHISLE
jgi:hypothetical protein